MIFDINSLEKITEIEVQLYDPNIDSRFNLQYLYEWDNSPNQKWSFDESIPQIISWGDGQFIMTPQRRSNNGIYVFYFKIYEVATQRSIEQQRTQYLEHKIRKFIYDKSSERFIYVLVETEENVLQLIKWDPFDDSQRLSCQYTGFKNTEDIFIGDSQSYIYILDSEYSEKKGNVYKLYQRALGKSGDKNNFSVVDESAT